MNFLLTTIVISNKEYNQYMNWQNWLAVGIIACVAYDRLSSETKQKWENTIKSHHGEWGLAGVVGGLATGNPGLAAFSAGLALHDLPDKDKWFTGDKRDNVSI